MNAQFSISASLNSNSNYLVCSVAAASAPGTILQTIAPTKAGSPPYYPNPFQVTFTGLTYGTAYIFTLWESPDMTAQGLVRNSSEFTALGQAISVRASLFIIADTTAGFSSGQESYVDTSLAGWTYDLENRGQGTMNPVIEYTVSGTGGWTIITGEVIQPAQVFVMHFLPQIATAPPPPAAGVSTGVVLTANTVIDNTYNNKEICLQGEVPQFFTVTLPSLSTVTDYSFFWFNSSGGSHVNVVIACAGTDKIQRNTQITQIILGQNEELKIYKARGLWYIERVSEGVDKIGQYLLSPVGSAFNLLNLAGAQIARNIYYRFCLWVLATQSPVAQGSWANTDSAGNFINKGFYGTGDGSTTIQLPLITGFLTSINGSSSPGRFSIQNVGTHKHLVGLAIPGGARPVAVYEETNQDMPGSALNSLGQNNAGVANQSLTGLIFDPATSTKNTNTVNKPNDTGLYLSTFI